MEFKSQIATTRKQSEELLLLGINPETADCHIEMAPSGIVYTYITQNYHGIVRNVIPAWSLTRLLELIPKSLEQTNRPNADLDIYSDRMYWFVTYEELGYDVKHQEMKKDLFDAVISTIDWLIREKYFNKEYLKGEEK